MSDIVLAGEQTPKMNKLTDKMAVFCKEYVICNSPLQAYLKAGYKDSERSHHAAVKLLKREQVAAEVARLRAINEVKYEVSKDFVFNEIKDVIEQAKSGEKPDLSAWLKALDMVAKLQGYYPTQKMEMTNVTPVQITIEMPKMDDDLSPGKI